MKRIPAIGLFLLIVLAGCTQRNPVETRQATSPQIDASPELSAIDSLMWQRPDSALAVLIEYFSNGIDVARYVSTNETFDRHYANLLLSELLYKNDYAQTNRAELLQAVRYFDSLVRQAPPLKRGAGGFKTAPSQNTNIIFLDARAHYINGVGYYESDSLVEACAEYLKALDVMEDAFEEKELVWRKAQFMAFTYTRLTELFSDLYLHEQAILFGKRVLHYSNKFHATPWHVAWLLNDIGAHFDMMKCFDSAEYYYKSAAAWVGDTNSLMYRDIAAHLAYLKYEMGDNTNAIIELCHLLSLAESEKEYLARSLNLGELYYHEKQFDSARVYLEPVFYSSTLIDSKKQAAKRLAEIYKAQQKDSGILEYADFLVPYANQEEDKSEIKSQMTELYKTYCQDRLERQHRKEARKHVYQALTVIAGMLFMILIISLLYHRNRQHKRKLETLIESERQAHKIHQAALAGRLKRSNAALKEHETIQPTTTQLNSAIGEYEDEPICQHILAICFNEKNPIKSTVPVTAYADIALNDMQKAQLKKAAMMHYGSWFENLKRQHPKLKEKDFQYCYLCLLGLDNIQIAVLLQNSISTIWERENRLKKIFGSEDRVAITLHGFMTGL